MRAKPPPSRPLPSASPSELPTPRLAAIVGEQPGVAVLHVRRAPGDGNPHSAVVHWVSLGTGTYGTASFPTHRIRRPPEDRNTEIRDLLRSLTRRILQSRLTTLSRNAIRTYRIRPDAQKIDHAHSIGPIPFEDNPNGGPQTSRQMWHVAVRAVVRCQHGYRRLSASRPKC